MESFFSQIRDGIIGINQSIRTPYHDAIPIVYADWTASGRMYAPIEESLQHNVYPFVANTHTETNFTGSYMTTMYQKARQIIKSHVNARPTDVLLSSNAGMTGVVNRFQRILGLKVHESHRKVVQLPPDKRPVIFVTHMEHHSNQTSWLETLADVVVVPPGEDGLVSLSRFEETIRQYNNRPLKIAAVTSCSNVTGIFTPYQEIAKLIHSYEGYCFVDFACSGPYIEIDMNDDPKHNGYLDAIYFSPHKFLGGPGSAGALIFRKELYKNKIPDIPGGGTVDWTNPWGEHKYIDDIEAREDGGTPAFLQTIRTALSIRLKEDMGAEVIHEREKELHHIFWPRLSAIPNLHLLADQHQERLPIYSFYIDNLHFNLAVQILNDRFGIQVRGGCSCAGTYGHYLLEVSKETSHEITRRISQGDCSLKPGWIRCSLHPTMTTKEVTYIADAIEQLAAHHESWSRDYDMDPISGKITHVLEQNEPSQTKENWGAIFSSTARATLLQRES